MLPLDVLDKQAEEILAANNVSLEKIDMAVMVDLNFDEKYCISWLAYSKAYNEVYLISPSENSLKRYDLDYHDAPVIESFLGSNRFLYHEHQTKIPDMPDNLSEKERTAIEIEYEKTGKPVIICYATNKCKRKLFSFVEIIERMSKGETVTAEDDIFKQYDTKCPKCGTLYSDVEAKICPHCDKKNSFIIRILEYYKPLLPFIIAFFTCQIGTSTINIITPLVQNKFLLEYVIPESGKFHDMKWLILTLFAIVGLGLLLECINIMQYRLESKITNTVTDSMKKSIFEKVQSLSLSFFGKNSVGNIITRVSTDADSIASFFTSYIPQSFFYGLTLIGYLTIVFIMNWKLSLIILVPIPFLLLLHKIREPIYYKSHTKVWRANSSLNSMVNDSISGIRVVKAFAKEADETNRYNHYTTRAVEASLYSNYIYLTIYPLIGLCMGMASQFIWGIGGILVLGEEMTYADFVTYFSYVGLCFGPLNYFTSNLANALNNAMNCAQRFYETMDTKPEVISTDGKVKIDKFKGEIELVNVNFSYTLNRPILKNVSMHINPGDQVGLVGHTGAGKSTIANLITRLYDPQSGKILIDGVDVKDIEISCLRKNMAIVSQEIFIFRGTVADNIRYGKPDATFEEVVAAAKAANAHDFIMRMPNGYDTVVGIGSRAMSGGEQQRISIARAILLAPSILILDEATAAMDTETERMIGKALDALVEGRTSISIAHRLSTLKNCNMLHAIEDGEIAESGTHAELIAKRGIYHKLYTLQSEANKKIVIGE